MPTYEYLCESCGHTWDLLQKISEDPVTTCPACEKATAKRQISGGNFILKGGGWYADLYSSSPKGGSDAAGSSKPSSPAPAASSESAKPPAGGKSGGSESSGKS